MHGYLVSTLKSLSKITCSHSDEYKSKFPHNAFRWFVIFLFGLYDQLNILFLLWKLNSIDKPSIGFVSTDRNFIGISSLIKTIFPSPYWWRTRRKEEAYPVIRNCWTGKDSYSLVSEITNTSIILWFLQKAMS